MADFGTQQAASAVYPLLITSGNTLLQDADPAMFYVSDFLSNILNNYVGARFVAEVSTPSMGLGVGQGAPSPITNAVGTVFTHDPRRYLLAGQFTRFPILAIYRTQAKFEWSRIGWETDKCGIGLDYVMPPMSAGQIQVTSPILRSVELLVRKLTTQSFDPSYTPKGGVAGQSPFGLAFAGLEEIGWTSSKYGMWEGPANSLGFAGVHMDGYWKERDMLPTEAASGRVKFAGADVEEDLRANDQTVIAPLVQFSTQQAPTIASIAPAGGAVGGGTSVTLTGTLFVAGAKVFFGNQDQAHQAASVVVASSTSITCASPAVSGPGAVPVTVVNVDGQPGVLAAAFTYS